MITAVDTNVLIDIFGADARFGPLPRAALERCSDDGSLVASDVVWAETVAAFGEPAPASAALAKLGVSFRPLTADSAAAAGTAWRAYRRAGGPRTRVIADFLVGAHAQAHADRLLSRDRGFFRSCFAGLTVLDPTT